MESEALKQRLALGVALALLVSAVVAVCACCFQVEMNMGHNHDSMGTMVTNVVSALPAGLSEMAGQVETEGTLPLGALCVNILILVTTLTLLIMKRVQSPINSPPIRPEPERPPFERLLIQPRLNLLLNVSLT
jgi:hypothetical protein